MRVCCSNNTRYFQLQETRYSFQLHFQLHSLLLFQLQEMGGAVTAHYPSHSRPRAAQVWVHTRGIIARVGA